MLDNLSEFSDKYAIFNICMIQLLNTRWPSSFSKKMHFLRLKKDRMSAALKYQKMIPYYQECYGLKRSGQKIFVRVTSSKNDPVITELTVSFSQGNQVFFTPSKIIHDIFNACFRVPLSNPKKFHVFAVTFLIWLQEQNRCTSLMIFYFSKKIFIFIKLIITTVLGQIIWIICVN